MPSTLLSDVAGRIRRVAFALPGEAPDVVAPLRDCMAAVLDALGPGTEALVVHHPEQTAIVRALGAGRGVVPVLWDRPRTLRLEGVRLGDDGVLRIGTPPIADYTPWIQDTFLVRAAADGPRLLASPRVARPDGGLDADLPAMIATQLDWPLATLPAALVGANVLVDGNAVLIGRNALADAGDARGALLDQLGGADHRTLILPGRGRQPVDHLDLVVALAGRSGPDAVPTAIVGSPALAVRITGQDPDVPPACAAGLDRLARELERSGYRVARIPVLRRRARPEWKAGWLSWTNVLPARWTEAAGERRRVVLPAYGTDGGPLLEDLDAAAAETWRALGFEISAAEGPFTWMSVFDAGVRCLTKVLERAETHPGR